MSTRTILSGLILGLASAGGMSAPVAEAGPPASKESTLEELLKERLATLRELVKNTTAEFKAGRVPFNGVQQAMKQLLHAELELCESDKERIKVLEVILDLAKNYEQLAIHRDKVGVGSRSEGLMAKAARLEAQIDLERAKTKAAKPAKIRQ